jgi:hypothetical protein
LPALLGLFLSACAVPLGPGYTIERESLELRYSPQTPGRIHLRADYRLKNSGTRDLGAIRAALPADAKNLRITIADREVRPGATTEKSPTARLVAIPFASPLLQKQRLDLSLEYDLEFAGTSSGGRTFRSDNTAAPSGGALAPEAASAGETFYFSYRDWFVELRPPEGFVSKGRPRANVTDLSVRVPANFRVLSGGRSRGDKRRGNEREFRFRFRFPQGDFDLFVLAGPYVEHQIRANGVTIVFWTLQPLPAADAQRTATRLAQTVRFFEETFGPRINPRHPVWLVESPDLGLSPGDPHCPPASGSFPHGVLLNTPAFDLDVASDRFQAYLDYGAASLWLFHLASPQTAVRETLGEPLNEFAVMLARQSALGDAPRNNRVPQCLRWFDESLHGAKEIPIVNLSPANSPAELEVGFYKGALFLYALEDRLGRKTMQSGIRRMVQALRGSTYGYAELRSALEAESGQDLGELFRTWLTQTGIPDEFRQRYAPKRGNGK